MAPGDAPPRRRRWMLVVGVVLLLAGLAIGGYVGWQYFGTNIIAKQKHQDLLDGLERQWSDPGKNGSGGFEGASAILRVPRFGDDYEVPIVEGFDDDALASGVGHLPSSAGPGEVGNYVLAGHRVTHGEPFRDFLDLEAGDEVVVETRKRTYTYVLDDGGEERTVDFSEGWVLQDNPYDPGSKPRRRLITLVTCSELFHTDDRQVVFGHLVSADGRDEA